MVEHNCINTNLTQDGLNWRADNADAQRSVASEKTLRGASNPQQVVHGFSWIAAHMLMLSQFLNDSRHKVDAGDAHSTSCNLAIAEALATQVGAFADEMAGLPVHGTLAAWVLADHPDHT